MSSHADNGCQQIFSVFFDLTLTAPTTSVRAAHFLWGLLAQFPMVPYKILGAFVPPVLVEICAIFFPKDDIVVK